MATTGCMRLQHQAHQSDQLEMERKAFHMHEELPEMSSETHAGVSECTQMTQSKTKNQTNTSKTKNKSFCQR